jgi:glyoxylase I family protein
MFSDFHHVAIICSQYEVSRTFYADVLGFRVLDEHWRPESQSWKCDLISGTARIELFEFPSPPKRPSNPEALGLRHLAFRVASLDDAITWLASKGVVVQPTRTDVYTGRLFAFFADPDGLPLEAYEE